MKTTITILSTLTAAIIAAAFVPNAAGDSDEIKLTANQVPLQSDASGKADCLDLIRMSPVAMMTTAGPTLAGPTTAATTIYSNGTVIISRTNALTGGSSVLRKNVPRALVSDLQDDLLGLGALRQCDQPRRTADLPMTTLTVFTDGPTSVAHSVSYWLADGNVKFIEGRIMDFVAAQVLN